MLIWGTALALGCAAGSATISDSTFVEVMYELISNKDVLGEDTAASALKRREALARYNVTEEDLQKKSAVLAEDLDHLADVWGKLRVKLAAERTTPR